MFNVCFQFTDIGKKMVVDLQGKELKNKYQTDPDKKVNIDLDHELKKLEEYFSNELDKIMKQKLSLILTKYDFTMDQYILSLSKFNNHPDVARITQYI